MKKLVVALLIILISPIMAMATDNVNSMTNDTTNSPISDIIKFSIKSKFLGYDKNWNTEKTRINITIYKLGRLIYRETYYSEGSEELKVYSSSRYYDDNVVNNNISFNILRPKSKSKANNVYSFIKSTIILDNKIIFEQMVNSSNHFRLDYTNMKNSTVSVSGSKTNTLSGKGNNTNNKTNDGKTGKSSTGKTNTTQKIKEETNKTGDANTKKSSGFEIIMTIIMISVVHTFRKKK